jgi:hypothetical protein
VRKRSTGEKSKSQEKGWLVGYEKEEEGGKRARKWKKTKNIDVLSFMSYDAV